jgi:hypothetical protein
MLQYKNPYTNFDVDLFWWLGVKAAQVPHTTLPGWCSDCQWLLLLLLLLVLLLLLLLLVLLL